MRIFKKIPLRKVLLMTQRNDVELHLKEVKSYVTIHNR